MNKGEWVLRMRGAGMSNQEVAEALGMPVPSVRRLASEAKRTCHAAEVAEYAMPGLVDEFRRQGEVPRRRRRHIVIPDCQVRPGVPTGHLLAAGRYVAEKRPDVVVQLGDFWDLPSLSSYEKPGSRWFEGRRLRGDIEAGNEALALLTEGMGSFRPERLVMLRGNHEDRLARAINGDPTRLEGLVGFGDFNDTKLGWEVVPFLKPIYIDGVWYSHYWPNPRNGRPLAGTIENLLKTLSCSATQGHRQGLAWGRRELPTGGAHIGLVAGSFYEHDEDFLSYQGNNHWRGIIVKNEVCPETGYDPSFVSLKYLLEEYS